MATVELENAIHAALRELGGEAKASDVVEAAMKLLGEKSPGFDDVRAAVWDLVDRRDLKWTVSRKIAELHSAVPA